MHFDLVVLLTEPVGPVIEVLVAVFRRLFLHHRCLQISFLTQMNPR